MLYAIFILLELMCGPNGIRTHKYCLEDSQFVQLAYGTIFLVLSEGFEPSVSRFVAEDFLQLNYESMCPVYWN